MNNEQKIDKIYDMVFDMKTEIAKSIVHQENHAKKLVEHETKITTLDEHKNKTIGKNMILSILSGSAFGGFVAWLGKHL